MARGEYLLRAFCDNAWAIQEEKLEAILEVIERHAHQVQVSDEPPKWLSQEHPKTAMVQGDGGNVEEGGSIMVLPVRGTITHRANLISAFSGGTSTEMLTKWIRDGVEDDEVSEIVLDIDSPGGSVLGIQELCGDIREAREKKKITAVANDLAASAAFAIGTQASELVVTPSGEVGSIGVFMVHRDVSESQKKQGVKTTFVSAGKYKIEGNPYEPLSDDTRKFLQSRVDDYYNAFIRDVAEGRGVTEKQVRGGFGEGRVVGAERALDEGMVDRIDTLDAVLEEAVGRIKQRQSGRRMRQAVALRARALELSATMATFGR